MSTCVRKCATRVSGNLRYLHFSSTAPKYRHLFTFVTATTHAGGNLARQGATLAATVAHCDQHAQCEGKRCTNNNIVGHQLRSDRLQSNIRWFLAQLNHQVCGVKPPQTDCSWVPGSQGTPSSGTTEQIWTLAAKLFCKFFSFAGGRPPRFKCCSRHFGHWFRDELNKIQVPKYIYILCI